MKRLALTVFLTALFSGCSDSPTTTGSNPGGTLPAGTIKMTSGTVAVSDSTITVIMTMRRCEDSVLVTESDTSTQKFILFGDTLTVMDSSGPQIMTRVGTGTGLEGVWSMQDPDIGQAYVVLTATAIEMWIPSDYFMTEMKSGLVSELNFPGIVVDTSNTSAIVMTGTKTGEAVTLTINSSAQLVWTSSDPMHPASAVTVINPSDCSVPIVPDWFQTFVAGNLTGGILGKAAMPDLKNVIDKKRCFRDFRVIITRESPDKG